MHSDSAVFHEHFYIPSLYSKISWIACNVPYPGNTSKVSPRSQGPHTAVFGRQR